MHPRNADSLEFLPGGAIIAVNASPQLVALPKAAQHSGQCRCHYMGPCSSSCTTRESLLIAVLLALRKASFTETKLVAR